jgi:hypothetical protein
MLGSVLAIAVVMYLIYWVWEGNDSPLNQTEKEQTEKPTGPTESYKAKKIPLISPDYKSITVEQLWDLMHDDLMHDDPIIDAMIKVKVKEGVKAKQPIKSGIRTIKGKRTLVWSPEPTTSAGPSSPSKPLSSPSKPRRRVKPRAKVRAGKARPRHVP